MASIRVVAVAAPSFPIVPCSGWEAQERGRRSRLQFAQRRLLSPSLDRRLLLHRCRRRRHVSPGPDAGAARPADGHGPGRWVRGGRAGRRGPAGRMEASERASQEGGAAGLTRRRRNVWGLQWWSAAGIEAAPSLLAGFQLWGRPSPQEASFPLLSLAFLLPPFTMLDFDRNSLDSNQWFIF